MNSPVLGLEIGPDLLCGVIGRAGSQSAGPVAAAVQSYAPGGEAAALAALLQRLGWRRGRVMLGLAPGLASLRRLHLPFANPSDIRQVIGQALADQFPQPLEELLWDQRVVRQTPQGSDLLALALPRTWLQAWLPRLHAAGLTVTRLDLGSMALAGRAAATCPKNGPPALLLDAAPRGITLALLCEGEVQNLREMPWPAAWAADHPPNATPEGIPRCPGDLLRQHLPELATMVRRTLRCWQLEATADDTPPTQLLTAGWLAADAKMAEALASELALTPRPGPPLPQAPGTNGPADATLRPLLARATALALSRNAGPRGFALPLPRTEGFQQLLGRRGRLLAVLVVLLLLGAGAVWGWHLHRLSTLSRQLDEEMARLLRDTFPATGRIVDPLQQFLAQVQTARSGGPTLPELAGRRRALHTLASLSRILSQDPSTRLNTFALEHDLVQLRGEAASYRAVQNLHDRLAAVPDFVEVVIVSASSGSQGGGGSGRGRVVFQLKFRLRSAA
ncbi:MAG: hypothetical protein BWK76_10780 [Desulfobulbaceae bacterium A2]|nr:MAG: hypothetical protein BWK76_10780 [Desulfobulbaceae bacterium A2]